MEYALRTNALTKVYHGKNAVSKVTMNVGRGEIYGLIGKNGAGKTTLMKMIMGLAAPGTGTIELFGSTSLDEQRKRLGCIIESPALYPYMTALQNLENHRILLGLPDKGAPVKALQAVGLTYTGKKTVKHFSMGMKQRLSIAMALLGNPDFLVLDELINGLDPTGIRDVRDLLLKLNKEDGITILISSHILGELYKIATCYGILNDGMLVEEFTKDELELRCRRCLKVEVDDAKQACILIEELFHTRDYDVLDGHIIRIFGQDIDSGLLNKALTGSGITVKTIQSSGEDLEGYFMERMGGTKHA